MGKDKKWPNSGDTKCLGQLVCMGISSHFVNPENFQTTCDMAAYDLISCDFKDLGICFFSHKTNVCKLVTLKVFSLCRASDTTTFFRNDLSWLMLLMEGASDCLLDMCPEDGLPHYFVAF
ncbi:hypothetical protein ILYODFUR_033931 [Ilyodon furcidens]|uniref:Uncharacterized protein n=1 Tax=Ilyodon furcidens TaxID=33524 RepID=A0ABV0TDB6_9TELE